MEEEDPLTLEEKADELQGRKGGINKGEREEVVKCSIEPSTSDESHSLEAGSSDSNGILIEADNYDDFLQKIIEALKTFQKHLPESSTILKQSKANKPKKSKQTQFPAYLSTSEVDDGLKSGQLIKGIIRINPKNNRKGYISNKDPKQEDYLLDSADDRNRALEGDVVVIKLKPQREWAKNKKTAVVVYILERVHSRITVGTLKPMPDNNKQFLMLVPRDYRVPKIRIQTKDCPSYYEHPKKYKNILFKVKITGWSNTRYAVGTIIEKIGITGDLDAEITALVIENDLDIALPSEELLKDLTLADSILLPEFTCREDLRKECVFTIDPLTAHDLDDAISCKELPNGNLEIGVHISDVTHYLKEGTALDKFACRKATTIYLADKAFHMLPQELCQHCSLSPGSDKLTLSVIWEMTKSGKVIHHRFARTVINSCVQLAYEHAQAMIDNPNHQFKSGELPEIFGGITLKNLSTAINCMHKIAQNLRAQRFREGALQINQTKLIFQLNEKTGEPSQFTIHKKKEADSLIEELMLLANKYVASKIAEDFPNSAFLRCHDPPNQRLLVHWKKTIKLFGVDLDISSSKALQSSICAYQNKPNVDEKTMAVLKHLIIKPMKRARYFCAANSDHEKEFHHYALNVPIYTHFTSPIRRYADIVVHRFLSASLGYTKKHLWKVKYLTSVAQNCNKKKWSAKCAQEISSDLYLAHYIEQHEPFIQDAVVVDVKKNAFDVFILATGSVIRMYPNSFGDDVKYIAISTQMQKIFSLTLPATSEYLQQTYVIHLFAVLKVSLKRKFKTRRLEAKIERSCYSSNPTVIPGSTFKW